ncbi:stage V sporulation protein AA [Paenibacillus turpanensis]|uniref:stage V sporulation protein AA n=1 Tax=Paenibacillus turpanensis TaxID=2689078 RepID=UPI00140CD5D9|nr:stage V sporulation protein AA [Paenibacillus turpanensis]
MRNGTNATVYLRLPKRATVPAGEPIRLGQVAQLIVEPEWEAAVKNIVLYDPEERDGNIVLIDMIRIVDRMMALIPDVKVEHFGEPHVLVDIYAEKRRPGLFPIIVVWILLFLGSGLAIMNFHEDVAMEEVHRRLTELLTGERIEHPYWMQIPYSIGIGLGMVLFFNHVFKKKFNEEPTPLEVELFLYQENINQYVIADEYRRLAERTDR